MSKTRKTIRHLIPLFLIAMLAVSTLGLTPSHAASKAAATTTAKTANIRITHLKAYNFLSRMSISKEKQKKGYRNVWVTWTPKGSTLGATYYIYVKKTTADKYVLSKTTKGMMARLTLKNTSNYNIKIVGVKNGRKGKNSIVLTVRPGSTSSNATQVIFTQTASKVAVGDTIQFSAYANGTISSQVQWTSSKNAIATVSNGTVTGVSKGTVYVNAIAHNGVRSRQQITVIPRYPEKVTISGKATRKLSTKETVKLSATTTEAGYSSTTWSTSNKKVATVNSSGKVTAKGSGTATITCTAEGGAKATVKVSVEGNVDAMLAWAKKIANDDSYGYSMGTSIGKGRVDRYCHTCNKNASKDYDCASFVAAAVAHGYGDEDLLDYCKWSGGCTTLKNTLLKHGWKNVGKLSVSKLKPGDILINPSRHVEIYVGNGQNVGAHDNYDGKSGDKSGREINIQGTWNFYTMVLRHE